MTDAKPKLPAVCFLCGKPAPKPPIGLKATCAACEKAIEKGNAALSEGLRKTTEGRP